MKILIGILGRYIMAVIIVWKECILKTIEEVKGIVPVSNWMRGWCRGTEKSVAGLARLTSVCILEGLTQKVTHIHLLEVLSNRQWYDLSGINPGAFGHQRCPDSLELFIIKYAFGASLSTFTMYPASSRAFIVDGLTVRICSN